MLRRSNRFKFKTVKYFEDMPKPKRGEIVVVPMDNRIMEFAPYLATKLPSWWAELPKEKGSIRRCQGTYDFVSAGIIMPLWTDITIRPDSTGKKLEYRCPSLTDAPEYQIQNFSSDSTTGCPIESQRAVKEAQYPKFVSPWRFKTPKGISLMVLPILHEQNPNYQIIPGVVHTDSYSQIHIVVNVLTDKEFTIPAGTPMQQMIPFKRTEDTKRIIFGNESMHRFWSQSGLGRGGLVQEDSHSYYRRVQRQMENELIEEEDSAFIKKIFRRKK
jgi:hypothetical protein